MYCVTQPPYMCVLSVSLNPLYMCVLCHSNPCTCVYCVTQPPVHVCTVSLNPLYMCVLCYSTPCTCVYRVTQPPLHVCTMSLNSLYMCVLSHSTPMCTRTGICQVPCIQEGQQRAAALHSEAACSRADDVQPEPLWRNNRHRHCGSARRGFHREGNTEGVVVG